MKVGFAVDGFEINEPDAELVRLLFRQERVIRENIHIHTDQALRDLAADLAETDNACGLIVDFDADEFTAFPLAGLHRSGGRGHVAREIEQQRHCQLSGGDRVSLRRVDDKNALLRRSLDIDIVDTDTRRGR